MYENFTNFVSVLLVAYIIFSFLTAPLLIIYGAYKIVSKILKKRKGK